MHQQILFGSNHTSKDGLYWFKILWWTISYPQSLLMFIISVLPARIYFMTCTEPAYKVHVNGFKVLVWDLTFLQQLVFYTISKHSVPSDNQENIEYFHTPLFSASMEPSSISSSSISSATLPFSVFPSPLLRGDLWLKLCLQ